MANKVHQLHIYTTNADLIQRLKDEAHHRRISKSQLALQYILHGLNEAEREGESPIYERPGPP